MTAALALPSAGLSLWQRHLAALAVVAAAILLLFRSDAADMAAIWWNASTFNHCLLMLPILAWLVWQRAPELGEIAPSAWPPGLALAALGAFAWLLGEAGSLALARHLGLVVMLQGAVVSLLGREVSRGLAFPIFYALFLVPAGEELVPALQALTARMTMALLGWSGVPAHIEGVFITTPGGYFEVAEACAGVKFLVAMAAFGALAANLCFRSWPRRIAFIAACLAVPILANGVRAWGTILIAQSAGIEFAAGFDHVFYGWIFFALVIALVLGLAWPFFDRRPDEPWLGAIRRSPERSARLAPVAAALAAIALLPPLLSAAAAPAPAALPQVELPQVPGWTREAPPASWRPAFAGADRTAAARYRDREGRAVDLFVAVFARQEEGREMVGYGQGAAPGWTRSGAAPPPPGGRAERIASGGLARELATFYRIGDRLTGSGMAVKLETMKARLTGGDPRAVAVLVSAEAPARGAGARPAIDSFLAALGPVERLADRAAGRE